MRVGIVGHHTAGTNVELVGAWRALGIDAAILAPDEACERLGEDDVALLRLDVLRTLDGVEAGLECVPALRRAGVRVLNPPRALLGAHDKLETARRLEANGVRHPRTVHVRSPDGDVPLDCPVVVKPRHGSWGADVFRCGSEPLLRERLRAVASRSWFRRHGALVQELVEPPLRDLRIVVAGGVVVGAAGRERAPGEWRTNVSLGGHLVQAVPDADAGRLALAAAEAVGGDLVGVDLLPTPGGGYVVLELNGAVEFDERYSLPESVAQIAVARALGLPRGRSQPAAA